MEIGVPGHTVHAAVVTQGQGQDPAIIQHHTVEDDHVQDLQKLTCSIIFVENILVAFKTFPQGLFLIGRYQAQA